MAFVYVSNADSGDICVLHMGEDGALRPHSSLQLGGNLMPMALAPQSNRLYVARRSEPMAVLSLAVDPLTRHLSLLGETPLPASMAYLGIEGLGRYLLAASYPSHQITVSPIAPDGLAMPVQQVLPTGPNAHAIMASPCNRFVLASSLGGGALMVFVLQADTGHLRFSHQWQARAGAGPRHFRFDPQGRFVYLLNELDGTLDVLRWNSADGQLNAIQTLSTIPPAFDGKPWAADLHLTPDGRHLYTSERSSSSLAHFEVNAATGRLTAKGHTAVESQPRGFAIDPTGRHLLVAGQTSHHLGCWAIDADSGALSFQQRMPVGQGPNWVEVLA